MSSLSALNQIFLILTIISSIFTIAQIYLKIIINHEREKMVEKIIIMMEKKVTSEKIIRALADEGYPGDIVADKCKEINNLMNINMTNP